MVNLYGPGSAGGSPAPGRGLHRQTPAFISDPPLYQQSHEGRGGNCPQPGIFIPQVALIPRPLLPGGTITVGKPLVSCPDLCALCAFGGVTCPDFPNRVLGEKDASGHACPLHLERGCIHRDDCRRPRQFDGSEAQRPFTIASQRATHAFSDDMIERIGIHGAEDSASRRYRAGSSAMLPSSSHKLWLPT